MNTTASHPSSATADPSKTPPRDSARSAQDAHLESAFERLLGHQATPEDRARLHRVRESLGLCPNDALWDVLIALQYYYALYERFPEMIRDAARQLLTECKTESDRHIAHAKQQVQETLQRRGDATLAEVAQAAVAAHASLEKTIQQSARRIALASGFAARWPWMLGGTVIIAAALIFTGTVALGYGRQQGYASGYTAGYTVAMQPMQSQQPATTPPRRGR